METSNKISAAGVVVAVLSALVSTWAAMRVSQITYERQEERLRDRLQCKFAELSEGETGGSGYVQVWNSSLAFPVCIATVKIVPMNGQGSQLRGVPGQIFDPFHVINPRDSVFVGIPKWSDDRFQEFAVFANWYSRDLPHQRRQHVCKYRFPRRWMRGVGFQRVWTEYEEFDRQPDPELDYWDQREFGVFDARVRIMPFPMSGTTLPSHGAHLNRYPTTPPDPVFDRFLDSILDSNPDFEVKPQKFCQHMARPGGTQPRGRPASPPSPPASPPTE